MAFFKEAASDWLEERIDVCGQVLSLYNKKMSCSGLGKCLLQKYVSISFMSQFQALSMISLSVSKGRCFLSDVRFASDA